MESSKPSNILDSKLELRQVLNWKERLQSFTKTRLVATVVVSASLNFGLTGFSTWQVWNASQNLQNTVNKSNQLQALSSDVVYLDEVLTMSARMFASTGQASWENRYNSNVPKLDKAIASLLSDIPKSVQSAPEKTDAANKKLVDLETKAFQLVKAGQLPKALETLMSAEYLQQKEVYKTGIDSTIGNIKTAVTQQMREQQQTLNQSLALTGISVILLALSSSLVVLVIRSYIRDQQTAKNELADFQSDLLKLNEKLGQEVSRKADQQQQILSESLVLQEDIAHILDVVCDLEEGKLTTEADVNERATGLISDTLNRLIESLNRTVSTVTTTATQVTNSAMELESVAIETAVQSQQQTLSIAEVKQLIELVTSLTDNSRQQTAETATALNLAQSAITGGQQEMTAMVEGIVTLQQGTEQIIKRTESLNNFVELATQFSKDQKRVAALTKVLALNAALLSGRAIEEQDPEQFASIAREFETIATQVNNLASETNLSLGTLQQRTTQIQTVTSGLNQDVSDINQLVQKFTNEVDSSRRAFENIQSVTERVAAMGNQVNLSSQEIAKAVANTLNAMQSIAAIAQNTEQKATMTRQQVEEMRQLAGSLLEITEFFQLRANAQGTALIQAKNLSLAAAGESKPALQAALLN
jgi:methyl-accepting chemotaxis protein PixJ